MKHQVGHPIPLAQHLRGQVISPSITVNTRRYGIAFEVSVLAWPNQTAHSVTLRAVVASASRYPVKPVTPVTSADFGHLEPDTGRREAERGFSCLSTALRRNETNLSSATSALNSSCKCWRARRASCRPERWIDEQSIESLLPWRLPSWAQQDTPRDHSAPGYAKGVAWRRSVFLNQDMKRSSSVYCSHPSEAIRGHRPAAGSASACSTRHIPSTDAYDLRHQVPTHVGDTWPRLRACRQQSPDASSADALTNWENDSSNRSMP